MIYFDNHATTPLDPVALEAMVTLMREHFSNPASPHAAGQAVAEIVDASIEQIANCIGAAHDEIVVTSGATESNNLAIFGACLNPRQRRRKVVSVVTEHKALLDPLKRLEHQGFEVVRLPVESQASGSVGMIAEERLQAAVDDNTALLSIMLANNEIGTIQSLGFAAELCRHHGCILHTDASQALGRMQVNVDDLDVDLMSFSAHKFYGPKGVGGLYVRNRGRRVRLQAQIVGGGQQMNLRSGTLNSVGIVGMQVALAECLRTLEADNVAIAKRRNELFDLLKRELPELELNGQPLDSTGVRRLPGNLNCSFFPVEGQSLILHVPQLAMSSGSACTSADPRPSHVLESIGLSEERSRSSLRFGLGRFNTDEEVRQAVELLSAAARKLRQLL